MQEKYLTKEQVKEILEKAPSHLDKGRLIEKLVKERGYTLEGLNDTPENMKKFGVQGLQQQTPIEPQTPTEQPGKLEQFATGVGKGVLSTIKGAGQIGEKIGHALLPTSAESPSVYSEEALQQGAEEGKPMGKLLQEENLEAKTGAEKAGKFVEQVAEFFIPAGKVAQVEKALSASKGIANIAAKLTPLIGEKAANAIAQAGGKAAVRAIEGGGVVAVQSGGDTGEIGKAGAISAALPAVGGAIGLARKGISRGISEASGLATGQGYGGQKALREAIEAGGEKRSLAQQAMRGKIGEEEVLDETQKALSTMKAARNAEYVQNLKGLKDEQFVNKGGQLYIKKTVRDATGKVMNKGKEAFVPTNLSTRGVKSVATKALKELDLPVTKGVIDFSQRPSLDSKNIQKVYSMVRDWNDITPIGLNRLRQEVAGFRKGGLNLSPAESRFNIFIDKLEKNVGDYVEERIPQIGKMNKQYAKATEDIEDIVTNLNLKTPKGKAAAFAKFSSILRNNDEAKSAFLKELDAVSGGKLLPQIAGSMGRPLLARGITKHIPTGAGTLAAVGGGSFGNAVVAALKAAGVAMLASSPRLASEVTNILGKTAKQRKAIRSALDKWLIQNPGAVVETMRD